MNLIKRFLTIGFVLITMQVVGQITQFTDLDSEYFQMKVKSLDDFIGRFNYEQDPQGNSLQYADSLKNKRLLLLSSLFDQKLIQNNQDSAASKTIFEFLRNVSNSPQPIFFDYFSPNWYAEAFCPALLNGKKARVSFLLRTVRNANGNTKWEIYDAGSSFLVFGEPNPAVFIGPASHNLNYLDISKTTEANPHNFISLLPDNFKPDRLSVITYLVNCKMLKLESINQLQFHVTQVPGFFFRIENLDREGSNSGWLITELKRTGE